MKKQALLFLISFFIIALNAEAQTVYVNAATNTKKTKGTAKEQFANIYDAVNYANMLHDSAAVIIRLSPGLYTLTNSLKITSPDTLATNNYIIEAMIMPRDTNWTPAQMPVIQVMADSNREGRLQHASAALEIERNNVSIRGLKFIGNPNPASKYYYAIERKNKALKNLDISQCYFIGEKNSTPIQGGIFAQGESIHVSHCIFYNCKNAVMGFMNVKDFSLTHSIIYGAYEGAVWLGYGKDADLPFTFHDNIIANGSYVFISDKGEHHYYNFSNSVIAGNTYYLGFNGDTLLPDNVNKPTEKNIQKNGSVVLNEVTADGVPNDYLHVSKKSLGSDIDAGIFINKHE